MEQVQFTWLKALPPIRAEILDETNRGISLLLDTVRKHPMQGFELDLVGRLLREIDVTRVASHPILRVAVLSGHTAEPLENAVRVASLRAGFFAAVYQAPLASYRQEILDERSGLYAFRPDVVLIAPALADSSAMPAGPLDDAALSERHSTEVDGWRRLWEQLGSRLGKPVLQHNVESPAEQFVGFAERGANWTPSRFVDELNTRMIKAAPGFVRWIDVDRLAAQVGRQNWRDPRLYHHGKFAFSTRFLPDYSLLLEAVLRNALGTAKKALILDLDNTLWGGVIGDDRLEGIRIGPETAEGAAYQAFCEYVRALGERGIILGICSKNDRTIAAEVFEKHPHMPLKLSDFAAIACNWSDKASNLKLIAADLNVDLSSLVFVDDNPAECELIRQALPQVHTVLLNGDPALFVRQLDQQHLFDSQLLSQDDLKRAKSYQARVHARALAVDAPNLDSYLSSLEMRATLKVADKNDLARLAQMEIKTNQFNLSTRRLTEDMLATMIASPESLVVSVSLADRFADHGLVSYFAATFKSDTLVITDWLMSCRVFSRTLEHFMFNYLAEFAAERGLSRIEARIIPTAKNKVMEGLFENFGFACVAGASSPEGPWEYRISSDRIPLRSFITSAPSVLQSGW